MVRDAEANRGDDKRKKAVADAKNAADGLIYTTEKSLEEYASVVSASDVEEIRGDLEALKAVLPTDDLEQIKEATARLEGSAYRIADAIYAAEQK